LREKYYYIITNQLYFVVLVFLMAMD